MGVSKRFHHLNYDATVELCKAFTLPSPEKRFIEILLPADENDDGTYSKINCLLFKCLAAASGLFVHQCRWTIQAEMYVVQPETHILYEYFVHFLFKS